jgi:hypothetical protein
MRLADENSCLDRGIVPHELESLVGVEIEDAESGNITAVANRAYDRQASIGSELEIASTMLPDDLLFVMGVSVRTGLQNENGVGLRGGHARPHLIVGNRFHPG